MERSRVRPTAVAGTFYPGDRARLQQMLEALLASADPPAAPPPRALVVPHAGYQYSGPVAATAYAHLRATRADARPVLVIGPSHYVAFDGLSLPDADGLATPLGTIVIDEELERKLKSHPEVRALPDAHRLEHSLEVQLPFLQICLRDAAVAALVVSRTTAEAVAEVIAIALGQPSSLAVVSTDLSHYHPADTARRLDGATARAVESLRFEDLAPDAACGRTALAGMLLAAERLGLQPSRLDLRNSSDTAGSPDRVVGYGAWSFA